MNQAVNTTKKLKFYRNAHWYLTIAIIITFAGFYTSYFSKLKTTDFWHHFHGLLATSWMLLLILLPWLYARGKIKLHRTIGKVSFIIVPLIVLSALKMIQAMIIGRANYPPMVAYRLAFLDVSYILQFVLFFTLAIVKSNKLYEHSRYMIATVFIFVGPGFTRLLFRIPALDSFDKVINVSYLLTEIVLLILIWDDKRTGKFRLPYILAFICFGVQHWLFYEVAGWQWWINLLNNYAFLK